MRPGEDGQESLFDLIDGYAGDTPDELSEFIESLHQDVLDSAAYVQQVTAAQSTQDPKIAEYTAVCRKVLKVLPKDEEKYESLS